MTRKYRQPGYMDSEAREKREKRDAPRGPRENLGPRTPQMPGQRTVSLCAQCGTVLPVAIDAFGKCPRCQFELHACKQCLHFDVASRFECTQPIPERIAQKDTRNECQYFAIRTTVERETSPGGARPQDARRAFENLFKK